MATNYWGQGASTNSIGWGQGASTNSISWGYIHPDSYGHPETDLMGLNQAVIDYSNRVTADGGTISALGCVNSKYDFFFDSIAITGSTFDSTFDNTFN